MIEKGIRTLMLSDTDIAAQIGTRVYTRLPQNPTLPAITYQRVSTVRSWTLTGPAGMPSARIQVDIWAEDYQIVKTIAELLRKRLDGYAGGSEGFPIPGIFLDSERDFYEEGEALVEMYRVSMDFFVNFNEEI